MSLLRQRMLARMGDLPRVRLPRRGYRAVGWDPSLTSAHARVLHRGFADTLDGRFFERLRTLVGCEDLMADLVVQPGFAGPASLLTLHGGRPVAAVQAFVRPGGSGEIGNLAVVPEHRGRGIGRWLLARSLRALVRSGVTTVELTMTRSNRTAWRTYTSLGFHVVEEIIQPAPEAIGSDESTTSGLRSGDPLV
jgi:ribosomal protein S18 acetylase RimI-like enzyme